MNGMKLAIDRACTYIVCSRITEPMSTNTEVAVMYCKSIICVLLSMLLALPSAFADPQISNVEGSVADSVSITITGTDFSTKVPAAPVMWEDVETGSFNSNWSTTHQLYVDNDYNRHGGSFFHAENDYSQHTYGFFTLRQTSSRWFIQYWFNLDETWEWGYGANSKMSNIKFMRFWEDGGNNNVVSVYHSYAGDNAQAGVEGIAQSGGGYFNDPLPHDITQNVWHCQQFEFGENSALGASDGVFRIWYDGHLGCDFSNIMTRNAEHPNLKYPFVVGWFSSWGTTATPVYVFLDDIYLDNTWARVEIGDNATYEACTHREIQIPTEWSPTQIKVTVNQGSFGYEDAYLFVVDSDGTPSTGVPVTYEPSRRKLTSAIGRWHAGELSDRDLHRAVYWYMNGTKYDGDDPVTEGVLTRSQIGNAIAIVDE